MKTLKDPELKDCPFCGGAAVKGCSSGVVTHIYCMDCRSKTHYQYSEQEAIDAWNTRPTPQPQDAAIGSAINLAILDANIKSAGKPSPSFGRTPLPHFTGSTQDADRAKALAALYTLAQGAEGVQMSSQSRNELVGVIRAALTQPEFEVVDVKDQNMAVWQAMRNIIESCADMVTRSSRKLPLRS